MIGDSALSTRAHTVPKFYLSGFLAPESEQDRDPFVWLGSVTTGEIKRRSPKNISLARGLYDGAGALDGLKPVLHRSSPTPH
jgi:hypothetical protein